MWKLFFSVFFIYSSFSFASQGLPKVINCFSEDHKEFRFVITAESEDKAVFKMSWDDELIRTGVLMLNKISDGIIYFSTQNPEFEKVQVSQDPGSEYSSKSYYWYRIQHTRYDSWRRPHSETYTINYDMVCSWD